MKKKKKGITLCCVASGSGSDFQAIANAWKSGMLPEVEKVVLISTSSSAYCLERAKKMGIASTVVESIKSDGRSWLPDDELSAALEALGGVDLMFLVGCIHEVPCVVPTYNIHPANTRRHGGKTMYGLAVHKHVLAEVIDEITRGWVKPEQAFYTEVTVHDADAPYDQGEALVTLRVQIPSNIIERLLRKKLHPKRAAQMLQKQVLIYEHLLLPVAVRAAAQKIMDQ